MANCCYAISPFVLRRCLTPGEKSYCSEVRFAEANSFPPEGRNGCAATLLFYALIPKPHCCQLFVRINCLLRTIALLLFRRNNKMAS